MVLPGWRRSVFEVVHNLSHPDIWTTLTVVANKFVWCNMNKQVTEWARSCIPCQQLKIARHVCAPLQCFEVPQCCFDSIYIDLVRPLPPSQGSLYLLSIVDRLTWWPEAIPLMDTSAKSCTWALLFHWVTRFSLPTDISLDRGAQFTFQLWTAMIELLGTKLHCTMAYHLQANGLVEHFHRHLKAALKARLKDANWLDVLPWVLLGICTAPKEDLCMLSAELVYSASLTVPGDFVTTPHAPNCVTKSSHSHLS